jgi:uncharacterized membrane protein
MEFLLGMLLGGLLTAGGFVFLPRLVKKGQEELDK